MKLAAMLALLFAAATPLHAQVYANDPEGQPYHQERRAVVRMDDSSTCTFLNSLRQDGRLFFIGARHAGGEQWYLTENDWLNGNIVRVPLNLGDTIFRPLRFDYLNGGAGTCQEPVGAMVTVRAIGEDYDGGYDYVLYEINDPAALPPAVKNNLRLLGWDARVYGNPADVPQPTVVIHHGIQGESNDGFKKISYVSHFETNTYGAVYFAAVVEAFPATGRLQTITGGASNSMVFSTAERRCLALMGTVGSGGTSIGGAYMSSIWTDPNVQACLDPDNTGTLTCDGADYRDIAKPAALGVNFCDGWPAPQIQGRSADGTTAWTDARAPWDWTDPANQPESAPLSLGASGITATWTASTVWAAGDENDAEKALYRLYLDDGQTTPGTGVRVTLRGLAQWLAASGHTSYQIRCYSNNDSDTSFHPITLRYGAAANSPPLLTMTPAPLGGGAFPTDPAPPAAGQSRGYADSPATLTADTLTITLPPRWNTTRGTLSAIRITGHGAAAVPAALTRDLWTDLGGWKITDLTANRARFLTPPGEIATITPADGISEANQGDFFATRHRGFLTAPATGWFRFWISADDEAELWLADGSINYPTTTTALTGRSGKRLIARIQDSRFNATWTTPGDFDRYHSQQSAPVYLEAGQYYYLETLHKDHDGPDHLALAWQPPGQARTLIPAAAFTSDIIDAADDPDHDCLPTAWETDYQLNPADNGLTDHASGQLDDPDGDGLDNLTEFQLGTDPRLADTDGDGWSDRDERDRFRTDPLVSNAIQPGSLTLIDLTTATATSVPWDHRDDGSAVAYERRGWTDYPVTVNVGEEGIHEITLTGGAEGGSVRSTENLPISFHLDGTLLGRRNLVCLTRQNTTLKQLTPWLPAGVHTVRVENHNVRAGCNLRINSLTFQRLGGPAASGGTLPLWALEKLQAENLLTRLPAASRTSPACVEGISSWGVDIVSAGTPIPVETGPDSIFYANIPLDPAAPTDLTITMQNGALVQPPHAITWSPTNIFEEANATLTIRKGDSLLLTSYQGTIPTGTFTLQGNAGAPPAPTAARPADQPLPVLFDTPGTHTLTAVWTPQGGTATPAKTLTVIVKTADFGPDFIVQTYNRRTWTPPSLIGVDLQPSSTLTWVETSAPGASPRSFTVDAYEPGLHPVLARLPETGDIIAKGNVSAFMVARTGETADAQLVEVRSDGSRVFHFSIIADGLPDNVELRLETYFQGATFPDGSRDLVLRAADIDPNGIANVLIEWTGYSGQNLCHILRVILID